MKYQNDINNHLTKKNKKNVHIRKQQMTLVVLASKPIGAETFRTNGFHKTCRHNKQTGRQTYRQTN